MINYKNNNFNIIQDNCSNIKNNSNRINSNNIDITIAMTTYKERGKNYLNVINQLLNQCNRFCICFNGYDKIPDECPKSNKIIAICANNKNGIKDLGCNNKMYWLGDFDGYYLTVDDDINYPNNYVNTIINKLKKYNNKVIVSFHGHIYNVKNGHINFIDRKVLCFDRYHQNDVFCHRLGMGVAGCYPKKIKIDKNIFLSKPKNFGDDEIVAIFAQKNNIPLICISNSNIYLSSNYKISSNGLWSNLNSRNSRQQYLTSYTNWKLNILNNTQLLNNNNFSKTTKNKYFFKIIIPTYNTGKFISRCIVSILNQTFQNFKIVIVDDASNEDLMKVKLYNLTKKHSNKIDIIYSNNRIFAGGCRNIAIDHKINSIYTLFIDSDDFLSDISVLERIYYASITQNFPDCITFGFNTINNNKNTYKFVNCVSVEDILKYQVVGAPRKCIKTSIVQKFVSNRRKYNDVIWHFNQCDYINTVFSIDYPIFVYTEDNPLSAWHKYCDNNTEASLYYVIADLLSKDFKKDICNKYKQLYINMYLKQIKLKLQS